MCEFFSGHRFNTGVELYIWYYIVLVVLQRKRCNGTMELDVFCLGCGCKTSKGDGRVLCSDAAPNALPMWEKIIDAKLQKTRKGD